MSFMTPAQARLYIPALTGTGEDANLTLLIDRLEMVFAWYLGFQPSTAGGNPGLSETTYTLYLDGPGGQELYLPYLPVLSIGSIHDDPDREYGSADLVAASDYELFGDTGLVILKNAATHGQWSTSSRAIKAVFNAGYSTVPSAIVHAGGIQIAHLWAGRNSVGKSNLSQGGASLTLKDLTLLPEVKESLASYRIPSAFLG